MTNFFVIFKNNIARLFIYGNGNENYYVEFKDVDNDVIEYDCTLKVNSWAQIDNIDNKNISVNVYLNNNIIYHKNVHDKINRVLININSNALGDNIAWIPYCEEYRSLNNIEVLVYTKYKELFEEAYPYLIFIDESDPNKIPDVDRRFRLNYGPELYLVNNINKPEQWYEENKNFDNLVDYYDYRDFPLQHIASIILGLSKEEIVPKVKIPDKLPIIKGNYVVVAIQSTSQMKYWNNPTGWNNLFDFLGKKGYKVVIIDKNKSFGIYGHFNQAPKLKNVIYKTGNISLLDRIVDIKYAKMMITISSGLAWLSWAVGTKVVMISGFTKPWNEFKSNCIRIYNSDVCNGCWNDKSFIFQPNNWLYCPRNNDFICSKAITSKDVIYSIKEYL